MKTTGLTTFARLAVLGALGATLAALATVCFRLHEERAAAQLDAAMLKSQLSTRALDLRLTERIIAKLENTVAATSNTAASAAADLAREEDTHAPLRAQIERMLAEEIRLNDLVRKLSVNHDSSAATLAALQRKFDTASASLQTEKARADTLARERAAGHARIAELETKFSQSQTRANEATAQLHSAQARIKTVETQLATVRGRIQALEAAVAAANQLAAEAARAQTPPAATP